MSDNSFKLDMFEDAYKQAVAANARGDVSAAKKLFMRASEIMSDIADTSAPPLDKTRRDRAEKLKFIAENLECQNSAGGENDQAADDDKAVFVKASAPVTKVSFDDIVGLSDAKEAIHNLLIDPLKNPEAYKKYGLKAGGFILLEGPPGTGKTTFAKAAACELSVPFADVNANSLVDSYIGKTGKNIDKLFDEARALAKKNGTPVVLFIDEIDYLAQKRGGENKTAAEAVPTLIKQMDGFSTSSDDIVLIAATNIKETLDPAILSRFVNVIKIPLPTEAERKTLFEKKLVQLSKTDLDAIDFSRAASISVGFSGRDITQVTRELKSILAARDAGIRKSEIKIDETLYELINKRAAAMR